MSETFALLAFLSRPPTISRTNLIGAPAGVPPTGVRAFTGGGNCARRRSIVSLIDFNMSKVDLRRPVCVKRPS
jgi:hypothetical protein